MKKMKERRDEEIAKFEERRRAREKEVISKKIVKVRYN